MGNFVGLDAGGSDGGPETLCLCGSAERMPYYVTVELRI